MTRVAAIMRLYRHHPLMGFLLAIMAAAMALVHVVGAARPGIMTEDLMTVWLMAWMSLAFFLGIMIKRQAANPFSHLLPGYRPANALALCLMVGTLCVLNALWVIYAVTYITPFHARVALGVLCATLFLLTAITAYVSIRVVVLTAYTVLLVAVRYVMTVLDFFVRHPEWVGILAAACVALLLLFIRRVGALREESWEYPYLLTWPLYRNAGTGRRQSAYVRQTVPPVAERQSAWSQVRFWAGLDIENTGLLFVLFLTGAAVYEGYGAAVQGNGGFFLKPQANIFFYTVLPVFISLFANHRILAYRSWAVMLPLSRRELARQWGNLMAVTFAAAWVLSCLVFTVVPAGLLGGLELRTWPLWEYLLLTGALGYMTLAVLCYCALEQRPWVVFGWILFFVGLISVQAWGAPYAPEKILLPQATILFTAAIWYRHKACQKWEREEVENL